VRWGVIRRTLNIETQRLVAALNAKLRRHYIYNGVTFNSRSLNGFFMAVRYRLIKWLNRRGGTIKLSLEKVSAHVDKGSVEYFVLTPLMKPIIKLSYVSLSRT
jgi:hypothetical protein